MDLSLGCDTLGGCKTLATTWPDAWSSYFGVNRVM